jgi:hypothetical protein
MRSMKLNPKKIKDIESIFVVYVVQCCLCFSGMGRVSEHHHIDGRGIRGVVLLSFHLGCFQLKSIPLLTLVSGFLCCHPKRHPDSACIILPLAHISLCCSFPKDVLWNMTHIMEVARDSSVVEYAPEDEEQKEAFSGCNTEKLPNDVCPGDAHLGGLVSLIGHASSQITLKGDCIGLNKGCAILSLPKLIY